jgi:hypothetical protein
MLLIRYISCCVVIFGILTISVGLGVVGYFLYVGEISGIEDQWLKVLAIVVWILDVVFLVCMACLCDHIALAFDILDATGDVIGELCCLPFVPTMSFFLGVGFVAFWIWSSTTVFSEIGMFVYKSTPDDLIGLTILEQTVGETYMQFEGPKNLLDYPIFWICLSFGILNIQVLIYFNYYVCVGAASEWYFARYEEGNTTKVRGSSEDELDEWPLCKATWRGIRYNFGTICFAAIVMTVLWTLKVFILFTERAFGRKNRCAKCVGMCLSCAIYIINLFNRRALILTGMQGIAFCPAGLKALNLMNTNLARTTIVYFVGGAVIILGKISVVVITMTLCILILEARGEFEDVPEIIIPLVAVAMISYIIASLFLNVFDNVVDAIFFCLLIDEKYGNGVAQYAPPRIKKLLNKHKDVGDYISKTDVA